jgi:hypothetical protein
MKTILTCLVLVLCVRSHAIGETWTNIDYPNAALTFPYDVSGKNVVGYYVNYGSVNSHGFLYDGSKWASLDYPGSDRTRVYAIDSDTVVGHCGDTVNNNICKYSIADRTWSVISGFPGAGVTEPFGLKGRSIVGSYTRPNDSLVHGFLYNGATWTALDYPGAIHTRAYGVSGNMVVGTWSNRDDWSITHGCLYDGQGWALLDFPQAVSTQLYGIDGTNVVGSFYPGGGASQKGFIYNTSDQRWTLLGDIPFGGTGHEYAHGMDGGTVVGWTYDVSNRARGFEYAVPEPTTLLLLGSGVYLVRRIRE